MKVQKLLFSVLVGGSFFCVPRNIFSDVLVAAGLKGTFTRVPDELKAYSPLYGVVFAENGSLAKVFAEDSSAGIVARLMFNEINGEIRTVSQKNNVASALTPSLIKRLLLQGDSSKPCSTLVSKKKEKSAFELEWRKAFDHWQGSKSHFASSSYEFLKALDTSFGENKQVTQSLLLAYLYLIKGKSAATLQNFMALFSDALSPLGSFTQEDFSTFDTLFSEALLTDEQVSQNIEQLVYWLVQMNKNSLEFLKMPLRYISHKEVVARVPDCVEGVIQTCVNALLFDQSAGLLTFSFLPSKITPNPLLANFISVHPNPHKNNYAEETGDEWMQLLSNLPNVSYKQETFEILPTKENILAVLNYLFGLEAPSLEAFAEGVSSEAKTIIFENGDYLDFVGYDTSELEKVPSDAVKVTLLIVSNDFKIRLFIALSTRDNHGECFFIKKKSAIPTDACLTTIMHGARTIQRDLFSMFNLSWNQLFIDRLQQKKISSVKDLANYFSNYQIAGESLNNRFLLEETFSEYCIEKGEVALLTFLIDQGVDVNIRNPLSQAIRSAAAYKAGIPEIFLEKSGQEALDKGLRDAVFYRRYDSDLIEKLLKKGANPNQLGLLADVVDCNEVAIVKLFLQCGASPNASGYKGETPLHSSVRCQNSKGIKLLLELGANPNNNKNYESRTPLLLNLCQSGNDEITQLLLVGGADPFLADCYQETPFNNYGVKGLESSVLLSEDAKELLHNRLQKIEQFKKLLEEQDHENMKLFLQQGAPIHGKLWNNKTAFDHAMDVQDPVLIQLLIDHDLGPIESLDYEAPLKKALQIKNYSIVELLLPHVDQKRARDYILSSIQSGNREVAALSCYIKKNMPAFFDEFSVALETIS